MEANRKAEAKTALSTFSVKGGSIVDRSADTDDRCQEKGDGHSNYDVLLIVY